VTGPTFIVPLQVEASAGPQAVHLLAAAWADAAIRRYGEATLLTPSGVFDPTALRTRASGGAGIGAGAARGRSLLKELVPVVVRTTIKDARLPMKAVAFARRAWQEPQPTAFVWQHHQPCALAGLAVARRWRLPLVLHVDAPVVWESGQWGVERPLGAAVERWGEGPVVRQADLITCPSEEVAEALVSRFHVGRDRVLVTPGGVDVHRFTPDGPDVDVGLDVEHVIGWVGSFRRFHGLEHLVRAVAQLRHDGLDVGLLLVGDGQDRPRIEGMLNELAIPAALTGSVPSTDVPAYLRAMDVACVTHPGVGGFHYSPMKLREYMASGVAAVVPAVGELKRLFVDGQDVCSYDPGVDGALVSVLRDVLRDAALRERVAAGGLAKMRREGSWDAQLERVVGRLL